MERLSASFVDFAIAVFALWAVLTLWRQRRRASADLSAEPRATVSAPPPQLDWLDAAQQARWQRQVQRFLEQKRFIGCAGFAVSSGHCRLVAETACLLRLQAGAEAEPLFPTVKEILLYPDAFEVPPLHQPISDDGLELVDDEPDTRIGEQGPGQVVLSWADVEAGQAGDVVQVVIHEFAHALDSENPETEGAPPMADYRHWSTVMAAEFARLKRHRRPPVLDPYGASSPAEFWCVAAEAFFQQPAALAQHHAALFELLASYFELRPPLTPPDARRLAAP